MRRILLLLAVSLTLISCTRQPDFDVVLRNGLICDGTGSPCTAGGVAINGDKIARTGDVSGDRGRIDIDVHGQVIAPGFINLMSAPDGLFADGRGLSDLLQGVTLEIFGEGESMGPLTDDMRAEVLRQQSNIKYDLPWHTLNEGLETLVKHGVSPNVASFIGAATPRINVLGRANRAPHHALDKRIVLVRLF
jgi:N-acyl-D-amino-acid deacylase